MRLFYFALVVVSTILVLINDFHIEFDTPILFSLSTIFDYNIHDSILLIRISSEEKSLLLLAYVILIRYF